jgi:branched-chain amino acid transport system permease protein
MSLPKVVVKGSAVHRVWQVVGWALLAAGILWVVYGMADATVTKFSIAVSFIVAILGLNLITGYSGQVSLGHSAFFGIGAYATAILMADHTWSFYWTIPAAAALGFVVGAAVGVPALRIHGLYLALVTLAIALAFPVLVKRYDWLTGGANGKTVSFKWNPPSWVPGDVSEQDWIFITGVLIAVVCFALASNMVRSRVGRGLIALRDNEIGAAVSGVSPAGFKVMAFAWGSMIGSVGGTIYTLAVGTVSPDTFGLIRSIEFVAGLVLGGVATISGAVIGGLIIEFLPYRLSKFIEDGNTIFGFDDPLIAQLLLGLFLIIVIFVAPGGIMWFVRLARSKIVVFVPKLPMISSSRRVEEPALAASVAAPDTTTEQGGVA